MWEVSRIPEAGLKYEYFWLCSPDRIHWAVLPTETATISPLHYYKFSSVSSNIILNCLSERQSVLIKHHLNLPKLSSFKPEFWTAEHSHHTQCSIPGIFQGWAGWGLWETWSCGWHPFQWQGVRTTLSLMFLPIQTILWTIKNLQKWLIRRENSPAALGVLEGPVVLWDQDHPERKRSIQVTWRQVNRHFKMFLLNYIIHTLGETGLKESHCPLSGLFMRKTNPLF